MAGGGYDSSILFAESSPSVDHLERDGQQKQDLSFHFTVCTVSACCLQAV